MSLDSAVLNPQITQITSHRICAICGYKHNERQAYSQSNYASLSGTVFDPQQEVLAGCSIQLTSENTGASRSAVTNDLGNFQITGLLPGDYKVSVQAPGFATLT